LLIDSYVASMVSCTLRLRCGMPTVLFSKTVSRAFTGRFICWFYYYNKRGASSTTSVWQISYSPAFAFFPHTVPVLWPDLLEELPRVQENIMTERNLMPTEFPLLEEGRQLQWWLYRELCSHPMTRPGIVPYRLIISTSNK
jgi:hypothetical protein